MAVSVVNAISNVEVGCAWQTANYTVALPALLQTGDCVILNVRSWNTVISTPAGWTLLVSAQAASGANILRAYLFRKDTVTAADSSTALVLTGSVINGSTIWYSAVAYRSSDGKIGNITGSSVTANNAATQKLAVPAVTATYGREMVLLSYHRGSNDWGTYWSPTSYGYTFDTTRWTCDVYHAVIDQGQSTQAGSVGWDYVINNVSAILLIARLDLLPLQATLTDSVGANDALPAPSWNLSTALTDAHSFTDYTALGRTVVDTLADALALLDETRWVNPAFSFVDLTDTFAFADEVVSSDITFSMTDPVIGKEIYRGFQRITSPYASPLEAYEAWCVEQGQSSVGTDQYFGTDNYYTGSFIDLTFVPYFYGDETATKIFIGASGNVCIFRTDTDDYYNTNQNVRLNGVGWQYAVWPSNYKPVLAIGLSDQAYYGSFDTFRMRRGVYAPNPRDEVVLYFETLSGQNNQNDRVRLAMRLRPGYIEIVTATVFAPAHAHTLTYLITDTSTNIVASAKNLVTLEHGELYHYVSRDAGDLITSLSDEFVTTDVVPSIGWKFSTEATDVIQQNDYPGWAWGAVMEQAALFVDTSSWDVKYGALMVDAIRMMEAPSTRMSYNVATVDNVKLIDAIMRVFPVEQSDGIALQDVLQTVRGVKVLERLGLLDSPIGKTTLYKTVADLLRVNDALRRFLSGVVDETVGIAHTETVKYNILRQISETVGILPALSTHLMLRVDLQEGVEFVDAELLNMIFNGTIAEGVKISAAYLRPGVDLTTWVVNARTGATTEYTNFGFNSFAQIGHKYLGASADGLFELNGDDDAGTDIITRIKGGFAQFNGSRFTGFKAVYLGVRGAGEFFLKLDTGDGNTYTYKVVAQDMQTTKVQLGKGLRARYFAYELISTGQDFDLDTIEFVPMTAVRRV